MEINDKIAAIEAILFACGDPVEIYRISQACDVDVTTVASMIKLLNDRYDSYGSGIRIIKLDNSYQMCTRKQYAENIKLAFDTKKSAPLSPAALEVLTIIAYNQPVSKGFVENVRGIDSSSVINNLIEKCLVEEAGRLDIPGKPLVYRTTPVFLRSFSLISLADLPPLPNKSDSPTMFDLDSDNLIADDNKECTELT